MNEWLANPLFWIALLSLLSVAAGEIFAFGQWKGRVDSDRALFKGLMAEVRNDIREIPDCCINSYVLVRETPLYKGYFAH